jgi:hypothetical protein
MSERQNADSVRVGRVGFTGTRDGMTLAQKVTVIALLRDLGPTWAHHGDCVGADADFHHIAKEVGAQVMIHPPSDPRLRAKLVGDDIAEEKPYLDRNRDIVNACEVIIATPKEAREMNRGGTWWTIRLAQKLGRELVIVWPNGSTDPEQSDGSERVE